MGRWQGKQKILWRENKAAEEMLWTFKIKLRGVDGIDKCEPKRLTKRKWKATEETDDNQV